MSCLPPCSLPSLWPEPQGAGAGILGVTGQGLSLPPVVVLGAVSSGGPSVCHSPSQTAPPLPGRPGTRLLLWARLGEELKDRGEWGGLTKKRGRLNSDNWASCILCQSITFIVFSPDRRQ